VINEIWPIGAKMFNVIDNRLKSIKDIQKIKLVVLMLSWQVIFIKHPLWNIVGSFKILKIMLMH
jgi:hypothetical protein